MARWVYDQRVRSGEASDRSRRQPGQEAPKTVARGHENNRAAATTLMTARDALDAANGAEPGEWLRRYESSCGPRWIIPPRTARTRSRLADMVSGLGRF